MRNDKNSRLVYSTDSGKRCTGCGNPVASCSCRKAGATVKGDGNVRVGRETKGRKGKGVTIISGLPLTETELQSLAKQLKQKCGSGGTVKAGIIEIQGDHRDMLIDELVKQGYRAKRSGG